MPAPTAHQDRSVTDAKRSDRAVIAYLAFLGMLMAVGIDIALPAFDEINADLDAGSRESLIVTFYIIGAAVGQLIVGPMSDHFGRRPTVGAGLLLYIIGAVACALAPSYGVLLAARFVWGLGASAPTGLRTAITRDLYSGDAMARIATIMMAVFLIGPVFIPLIGDGLLRFGPWPIVFWFAAAVAALTMVWTARFGETLPTERRRPLSFAQFGDALVAIARTRVTLGHLLASMFFSAAFFIFLGSAQPVFDRIFGRSDQFARLFALIGVFTIPLLLANDQLIKRHGARRMSVLAASVAVTASVVGAFAALTGIGGADRPGFWLFYGWLMIVTSFVTVSNPPMAALALEPMGDRAGTVSSLMFFCSFAIGGGLAAIVDARIGDTVVPFVVGYALFALIGFACQLWAGSPD